MASSEEICYTMGGFQRCRHVAAQYTGTIRNRVTSREFRPCQAISPALPRAMALFNRHYWEPPIVVEEEIDLSGRMPKPLLALILFFLGEG